LACRAERRDRGGHLIPRANITAWRTVAPRPSNERVEQDVVLSRALVAMFNQKVVGDRAVFRGGTALRKLFFGAGGRYSEDVDLVQRDAGPIGELIDAIREALDSWLGSPRWNQGQGRFTLHDRFETSFAPLSTRRLKTEINTREHFAVLGTDTRPFTVDNPWFTGTAALTVCHLDELLGTKLRALYQRKKGRDLFDLWLALGTGRALSARNLSASAAQGPGRQSMPTSHVAIRYVHSPGLRPHVGSPRAIRPTCALAVHRPLGACKRGIAAPG
jgi:predicted nucleotidyltransferase component of viral defense system